MQFTTSTSKLLTLLTLLTSTLPTVTASAQLPSNVAGSAALDTTLHAGSASANPTTPGALGSCGNPFLNDEMKVALSHTLMDANKASLCGRKIRVTNTGPDQDQSIGGEGNSVDVVIDDTCEGCDVGEVDLSVAAWDALTGNAAYSRVGSSWVFID